MNVETPSRPSPSPTRQTSSQPSDHDVIDSKSLERDVGGKPGAAFLHPALAAWRHHEIGHGPSGRRLEALPFELTFLSAYGAPPALLVEAAAMARRQAISPDAALLATGAVTDAFYYQSLARHLGVPYVSGAVALGPGARYPHSIHAGVAPLAGGDGPRWLAAPRGEMLTALLRRRQSGETMSEGLAIATPAHLSRLEQDQFKSEHILH